MMFKDGLSLNNTSSHMNLSYMNINYLLNNALLSNWKSYNAVFIFRKRQK
mgnify:FL=1